MCSQAKRYFISGIGGSGMLPLAVILKGLGHDVSGSDRSYDQGRTPEKFEWIKAQGIRLYPQDGSGVANGLSAVIISKAVEDTVPDIVSAHTFNIPIRPRFDMLVECFNAARLKIAISGTSGKTTTTGMTGFLLKEAGLRPSVMNGGVFLNYADENPYATAFVGDGTIFVSEIDESDGAAAVAAYRPDIAVLHNITLDHQPMNELKEMFTGFLKNASTAVLNMDDENVLNVSRTFKGNVITYSAAGRADADMVATEITPRMDGIDAIVTFKGVARKMSLSVPGRHNVSNALAALCAAHAAGLEFTDALKIIPRFTGIRRRLETIGTASGVTVIDDFAHNPDKVAASLSSLHEFPGRLLIFFQPHGYGFLKVVGNELADSFAENMRPDDRLFMTEPFYTGGTVDRSIGSSTIVDIVENRGKNAVLCESREDAGRRCLESVKAGDRIIVMGARDDSLTEFARYLHKSL